MCLIRKVILKGFKEFVDFAPSKTLSCLLFFSYFQRKRFLIFIFFFDFWSFFLSFFLSRERILFREARRARVKRTNRRWWVRKCVREFWELYLVMIKTALSRKRTRAVYFFLSLSLNSLLRRRTIWWESGWRFPLSLSVRVRRWWLKTSVCLNPSLTISGTKQPALCYDYMNFWAEKTKRAREEKTLCPGKKRERYKKIREARCYVLLSFARSFPTMMLKNAHGESDVQND